MPHHVRCSHGHQLPDDHQGLTGEGSCEGGENGREAPAGGKAQEEDGEQEADSDEEDEDEEDEMKKMKEQGGREGERR